MWAFNSDLGTFTRMNHNGSVGVLVSIVDVSCPGCHQGSVYAGKDTDLICVKCEKVYFDREILAGQLEPGVRTLTAMEESFLDYISSLGAMVEEMLEQLPKCWTFDRG